MLALLSPGDHVVCTYPGYQSLYEASLEQFAVTEPNMSVSFPVFMEGPEHSKRVQQGNQM